MSDDKEEVVIPTKEELLGANEEVVGEEDAVDPFLEQAIAMGYNPDGVEGKRNLSPEEFVDRQKLYDDIRNLKKQNKHLKGDIDNITKYQDRIKEKAREEALAEYRREKVQALRDEDYDKVADIDDKIADERARQAKEQKEAPPTSPEFDVWVEDNKWYNDDIDLRVEADQLGEKFWKANPEKSLEDVFEYVGRTVRKLNPDKFDNGKRNSPPAVEGAGTTPKVVKKTSSKYKASDLSQEEQSIMRTIVRTTKGMTEEKYLKEYFES